MNNLWGICLWPAIFALIVSGCGQPEYSASLSFVSHPDSLFRSPFPVCKPSGKKTHRKLPIASVYELDTLHPFQLPFIDVNLTRALEYHKKLLKLRRQKQKQQFGDLEIHLSQLKETIELLQTGNYSIPFHLLSDLNAFQIKGMDGLGNVKFTGYFTPVLKVRKNKTRKYKYPLYSRPEFDDGIYPSRKQIDGEGALKNMGLELAFASNPVDIYFMQLQGSGFVEYPDGSQSLFGYNGSNRHPYRSIGRFLAKEKNFKIGNISLDGIKYFLKKNPDLVDSVLFVNPSYSFFIPQKTNPQGAGHVPLTQMYSIAVDRRYIPLGSCLLAEVPVVDDSGKCIYHEYRILLAQDIGGAIRGPGHVDLYSGIGLEGKQNASQLHHYGRLWLLLPKKINEENKDKITEKW